MDLDYFAFLYRLSRTAHFTDSNFSSLFNRLKIANYSIIPILVKIDILQFMTYLKINRFNLIY